ncbi:MAG: antibiotic biosynthesis monooxygenase [Bacteroidia bacterium]|nr:antibiotic biosynthesis monooxygenase [Bacteroidia bacterium]
MISRIWHGYTTFDHADAYEDLLKREIFVGIKSRKIEGYKGIQLLKRNLENEVEFITIMWFDSIDAVRIFAGEDYEKAVVPKEAQMLLSHFDKESQHYEVKSEDKPLI